MSIYTETSSREEKEKDMIVSRRTRTVWVQDSSSDSALPITIITLPQTLTFC